MKTKYTSRMRFLAALLFLPFTAIAQNQGDATPLGSGGTKILCNSNEALTATVSSDGKLNFVACTQEGAVLTAIAGDGETLSVIPISNATNLNGVGAGMVGWQQVGTDTAETSSTTTVINATTHAARVGDILNFTGGTAGNIGVWSVVSAVGANTITLSYALPATPANGDAFSIMRPNPVFTPKEDSAHTTGDAGNFPLGVRNDDGVTITSVDLDYSPIAVGSKGQVWTQLTVGGGGSSGLLSPVLQEDSAFSASNATMVAGAQAVSAIAQTVGTTGDVAPPSMDLGNRLVITNAPAGEFFSSCSSAITGVSRTAIKTGVASNRIYTTSITCSNSGAAASIFNISDGAGAVLAVGALAATVGSYTATFPTPLRGSVNTDLSVTMNTTSTSTICCANGFISTT